MFVTADELTGCPPESTAHVRVPLAARSLGNGKSDKWEITRAHRRGGIESFLCPKSPPGSVPPSRPLPRPPLARLHSFAFSRTSDSRNRSAAFAERRPSPRDVRRVRLRVLSWLDGQLRPGPARRPAVCTCRSPFIRRLLRASRQLPRIPRLNPVLAGAGARGLGARGRGFLSTHGATSATRQRTGPFGRLWGPARWEAWQPPPHTVSALALCRGPGPSVSLGAGSVQLPWPRPALGSSPFSGATSSLGATAAPAGRRARGRARK